MQSGALRELNWPGLALNTVYVWVLGLGLAFLGRLFGLDQVDVFVPLLSIAVALITMWTAYRVAARAGQQPILHGLVLGLLVALTGLVLSILTMPISIVELATFLMQVLGGLLGGRSAQRVLMRSSQ